LTRFAKKITLLVRDAVLKASKVAQDKALSSKSMEVKFNTQVLEFRGENGKLETVVTKNSITGALEELHPAAVFAFIGLLPNTNSVKNLVALDPFGYICTGHDLGHHMDKMTGQESEEHTKRMPYEMETSVPGIFAAGDVRSGSTKQVAAAVGEGASAAIAIREYLRRG
jgi:thioredoxin reductase (NADPH)